jgi:hypothetical protein
LNTISIGHFLFSTLFFLPPASAEIKSLTINSDTRSMILFEKFGFTLRGHITISVSSIVVISSSQPESSRLGFFLVNDDALLEVNIEIQQNPSFCVLDSGYIYRLFTFRDLSPPPSSSFNRSFPVFAPNEYTLFFADCAHETYVSMVVYTEIFNLNYDGSKDYLSVGQTQLPSIFFLFFFAYLSFFTIWVYKCYTNKSSTHCIHLLMAVLLITKSLNLLCAAEDKHYLKVTGISHGWKLLFYIFQSIRVVLVFTIIVLIGAGWSFLKPFLQDREKKVLMIVIPLQVLANLAFAVIGEADLLFLLVDIICGCAVIFPLNWFIRSLEETAKADGKISRNLAKLTLFKRFYIVLIVYLGVTRIILFALRIITAYKYQWVSNAVEEITSFAFFIVMFYMFRPVEKNECFALDEKEEEEEEAVEIPLRDEVFEL